MQMQIVETNAGVAISAAPSMIARRIGFRCAMFRWTFSISTVASSTKIPTASDIPPRVMTFSVSPSQARMMIETRIESGIEMRTMRVLRQLPRKTRSMIAVRPAAIAASLTTPGPRRERRSIDRKGASSSAPSGGETTSDGENLPDPLHDVERARAPLLEHRHEDGLLPAHVDHVRLRGIAVADVGDVLDVDGGAVDGLDRNRRDLVEELGARVQDDRVLVDPDLRRTGGDDDVPEDRARC